MKRLLIIIIVMAMALMGGSRYSYADYSMFPIFVHFNMNDHSFMVVVLLTLLLMFINYVWNLIVIGLPAVYLCSAPYKIVVSDLAILTFLGQVGNVICMVPAMVISAIFFNATLGFNASGSYTSFLISNFLFSSIAFGLVAFLFLRNSWGASVRKSHVIAIFAGFLCNPVWFLSIHI